MEGLSLEAKGRLNRIEAEVMLIGSMLKHPNSIDDIVGIVPNANFFSNRGISGMFELLVDGHIRGKPHDDATLFSEMKKRGQLSELLIPDIREDEGPDLKGKDAFLLVDDCVSTNPKYFAEKLRDYHLKTELNAIATRMSETASNQKTDALELVGEFEDDLSRLSQSYFTGEAVSLPELLFQTQLRIDERQKGKVSAGLPTGYHHMDELTCGFQDSELALLAARPSVGKTALAVNLVRKICAAGNPAYFVSLEQSKLELIERLLCAESKVDSFIIRTGNLSSADALQLADGSNRLAAMKLWVDDVPCQTMTRIAANCRRMKRKHGIKIVFIDYLQLIEPDDRIQGRVQQVDDIARKLKHLARNLKIPVVALCQVNRAAENRVESKPRLSDLRESGGLEAHADVVWLLHRPIDQDGHPSSTKIEINVAKQRNGPTGEIVLTYLKQFMRFEDHIIGGAYAA